LPGLDGEVDVFEHRLAVLAVGEGEIAELDAPADGRPLARARLVPDGRLDGEDGVHPLEARRAALLEVDDIAERDQRPDERGEIEDELDDLARRDLPSDGEPAAVPDDDDVARADDELKERAHHGLDAHEAQAALGVLPIEDVEGVNLRALLRVGAHDPHAGEVLLSARGDLREEVLNLLDA